MRRLKTLRIHPSIHTGALLLGGVLCIAPSLLAQSSKPSPYPSAPTQGTSQPPAGDAVIVNDNAADAVPATAQDNSSTPAHPADPQPPQPATDYAARQQNPADGTDAGIVTGVPEPARAGSDLRTRAAADPDAGIVTGIPSRAGELPEGTTLRVRLDQELSTRSTERGAPFSAHLIEDIRKDGQIVIPSGATLTGRVVNVREGHRLRSSATLSLLPEYLALPDGTRYALRAHVVGTDKASGTRTLGEGTIASKDQTKLTVGETAAAAGGGAVVGATFGGGPGAAIGAVVGAGLMTVHLLQQTQQATLPQGTELIFGLTDGLMLTTVQPAQQN